MVFLVYFLIETFNSPILEKRVYYKLQIRNVDSEINSFQENVRKNRFSVKLHWSGAAWSLITVWPRSRIGRGYRLEGLVLEGHEYLGMGPVSDWIPDPVDPIVEEWKKKKRMISSTPIRPHFLLTGRVIWLCLFDSIFNQTEDNFL